MRRGAGRLVQVGWAVVGATGERVVQAPSQRSNQTDSSAQLPSNDQALAAGKAEPRHRHHWQGSAVTNDQQYAPLPPTVQSHTSTPAAAVLHHEAGSGHAAAKAEVLHGLPLLQLLGVGRRHSSTAPAVSAIQTILPMPPARPRAVPPILRAS